MLFAILILAAVLVTCTVNFYLLESFEKRVLTKVDFIIRNQPKPNTTTVVREISNTTSVVPPNTGITIFNTAN